MRVAMVVALAACGRVGFDAGASIGDGSVVDSGTSDGATVDTCGLPGLLLYLAFDEPNGAMAIDSSGNNHHGTLAGFSDTSRVEGQKGSALRFDGVDDRVDIGSPGALDDIRPLTACAWVLLDGYAPGGSFATIVDKSLDGDAEGWNLYFRDNGAIGFYTNYDAFLEGPGIAIQQWHHICGSWDGTQDSTGIELFLDGSSGTGNLARGGTADASDAAHAMTIGRSTSGAYALRGIIDELRIYNRTIDAGEAGSLVACSRTAVGN